MILPGNCENFRSAGCQHNRFGAACRHPRYKINKSGWWTLPLNTTGQTGFRQKSAGKDREEQK